MNKLHLNYWIVVCDTAKVRFFKQITTGSRLHLPQLMLFAILQKYDFSSKSQRQGHPHYGAPGCLRYCKSTIFQANHNRIGSTSRCSPLFAILQKYDFSSKSQQRTILNAADVGCLRYCKSTIFQANHNRYGWRVWRDWLFAILQKYDFSSKSQQKQVAQQDKVSCLRYCKSTIFQANHNRIDPFVVKQGLFAILQKYDFSSKSQQKGETAKCTICCLRYCKSTIFQANHNIIR